MEQLGLVSHIQTYCTKDGPGIRTTAFLIGCNLRCQWCANPEAMYPGVKLFYHHKLCQSCGKCVSIYPEVVKLVDNKIVFIQKDKLNIEELVKVCNYQAYQKKGSYYTASELAGELKKDIIFFKQSGGGVTFSGGEPLLQPEFLLETIKLLKEEGITVVIESAGNLNFRDYPEIIELVDLFLYDIKTYSNELHLLTTKVGNSLILENLKYLQELDKEVIVRMVVVPNYNDDIIDLKARLDYVSGFKNIKQVDILKYHNYGEGKYLCLGKEYPLKDLKYDETELDFIINELKEYGLLLNLKITVGG